MKNPLVSIIIPCYNQGVFLKDCLSSILSQKFQNWECIIIDDGSTDETSICASEFVKNDSRFSYYYMENGGASASRNYALKKMNGDFIQFLDADDILHPNKLLDSVNRINKLKSFKDLIVISNYKMFRNDPKEKDMFYSTISNKYFNLKSILYKWDIEFTIPIHCPLFSVNLLKKFEFPEKLKAKVDWVMWVSIFSKEVNVIFIDKIYAYYRLHGKNMTQSNSHMRENTIMFCKIIKKYIKKDEYENFLIHMLNTNLTLKKELQDLTLKNHKLEFYIKEIKRSNTYKFSMKLKRILDKFKFKR